MSWISFYSADWVKNVIALVALLSSPSLTFADEVLQPNHDADADAVILRALASKDDEKASSAILVARGQSMPSSRVTLRLVEIVDSDRSDYLRALAASAVGDLCPEADTSSAAKSAVRWLKNDLSSWVREGAAISLGRLTQDCEEVVVALIDGTKDVDPDVRFASYISLGLKRHQVGKILQSLHEGIHDRSPAKYAVSQSFFAERAVAIGAITSLGLHGKSAKLSLPQLMLLWRDSDRDIGVAACIAAAKISDDAAVHLELESALMLFLDVDENSGFALVTCQEALKCLAMLEVPVPPGSVRTSSVAKVRRLLQNLELQIYDPDFTIAISGALKHFGKDAESCLPLLRSRREEIDSAEAIIAIDDAIEAIENDLVEETIPADGR